MPSHVSAVRYLCTAASSLSRHLRTLRHIKVESTVKRSHSTWDLLQERSAGNRRDPRWRRAAEERTPPSKSAERLNGRALKTTYTVAHKSAFRIPKEISRSTVSFLLCVCVFTVERLWGRFARLRCVEQKSRRQEIFCDTVLQGGLFTLCSAALAHGQRQRLGLYNTQTDLLESILDHN